MKTKNRVFKNILLISGGILVILSTAILIALRVNNKMSIADNAEVIAFLNDTIPPRSAGIKEERYNSIMPVIEYNGVDYAAILEFPKYSVELPILYVWSRYSVNSAPCRYTGNPYDGTLIIGGGGRKRTV